MITDVNDLVYADYTEENGNKKLTDVIIIEQDDNAVNPNLPVVNAYDYEVDYVAAGKVKVNYYTGLARDDNTLIDVILSVMTDDGYTNFKVTQTVEHKYSIEATKGYMTSTFTFDNTTTSPDVVECVKISLNGESMLAKKGVKLDAAGVTLNGTYAEGVKKDGTPITRDTVGNIDVLDGAAYETYYRATVNLDTGLNSWTADKTTEYVKSGDKLVVTITRNVAKELTTINDNWTATGTGVESCKVTLKTAGTTTVKPVVEYTVTLGTLSTNPTITLK